MLAKRKLQVLTALALMVVGSACGGQKEAPSPDAAPRPTPTVSADEYFARSCAEFRGDAAIDVMLNGLDQAGVDKLNAALDLAWKAGKADKGKYGDYAESLQAFAEGMGRVVSLSNDRNSDPMAVLNAAGKVPFPDAKPACPMERPDSGGLPLPDNAE